MSMFLTRPHPTSPYWLRKLIWARNLLGWIIPALRDATDEHCGRLFQTAVTVIVGFNVAAQIILWVIWYYGLDNSPPLGLIFAGSFIAYISGGAFYHSLLLQMGGRFYTSRPSC